MNKATQQDKWVFIFLPVLVLAVALLAYSTFSRERTDATLTNAVSRAELMTRGIEHRLLAAFSQLTTDFYDAASIQGYEGLFEEQVLTAMGLKPRPGAGKQTCDGATQKALQTRAKAHTLYSPFAFLPETYVMVQRIPLVTEPAFERSFPATVLMLPMTAPGDSVLQVIDCGRRVFLVPTPNSAGQAL
jgi:hypothetical protein